jgi:hypothetical protein
LERTSADNLSSYENNVILIPISVRLLLEIRLEFKLLSFLDLIMVLGRVGCLAKYSAELLGTAGRYKENLRCISKDSAVVEIIARKHMSHAATGVMGSMFYDMCCINDGPRSDRWLVGKTTSEIYALLSTADDVVDLEGVTVGDKVSFLNDVSSDMLGKTVHLSQNPMKQAAYSLAGSISKDVISRYGAGNMGSISERLIDSIGRQFVEKDERELLKLEKNVGSCCAESLAEITEIVTGTKHLEVRTAAVKIGEYGQVQDDCCDVDKDLANGVNTFFTASLKKQGDTSQNRKTIRNEMMSVANRSFAEGLVCLNEKGKAIFEAQKAILDIRYRVFDFL